MLNITIVMHDNWVTLNKQLNTLVSKYDQSFYRLILHFVKIS